jgi:hypothetical protein
MTGRRRLKVDVTIFLPVAIPDRRFVSRSETPMIGYLSFSALGIMSLDEKKCGEWPLCNEKLAGL